jgi:protein-S-isoprenylcysteine O-methyltransferase Ste14
MAADRSLLWPTIGTVLFVLTVPGTVVVYVPYALSHWTFRAPLFGLGGGRWMGLVLIVCALPIFFDFVVRFVREGEGTPAPVAPTMHLVVGGTFRHVRNPGYIAVLSLLVGQALLFASVAVLLYALIVALAFHIFVVLYEEPTLRRQFGDAYEAYCRDVPRWLPRWRLPR